MADKKSEQAPCLNQLWKKIASRLCSGFGILLCRVVLTLGISCLQNTCAVRTSDHFHLRRKRPSGEPEPGFSGWRILPSLEQHLQVQESATGLSSGQSASCSVAGGLTGLRQILFVAAEPLPRASDRPPDQQERPLTLSVFPASHLQ